jgi:lipid-binding SYLF domain-containing protein
MPETAWEKTKKYSGTAYTKALKPTFDKVYYTVDKLGPPINRLSNKLGAEAFWPTSLDKESDKAARILRSFCKDGFYTKLEDDQAQKVAAKGEKVDGPQGKQRVLQKVPAKVIQEAKGLAIFTTMRTGLWLSGAGGSGVLVARDRETGEWSPPSGIMLHTIGLGFLAGVDIYDCVVVINTYEALEAFTKVRCTLGGEVSVVAGPVGLGGVLETEVHKRQAPVWTYLKSRGLYAGVQVDGTIVIERTDENEIFYGERIPVAEILAGKAKSPPEEKYRMLMETIKAAQGDEVDENELPAPGLAPGDLDIDTESKLDSNFHFLHQTRKLTFIATQFGIPDVEDPDPYGVKALQAEGFQIREAGTKSKPSPDTFEFKPAITSPVYSNFRKSVDLRERANSWRGSMHSIASVDKSTQTDEDQTRSSSHSPTKRTSQPPSPIRKETEHVQESSDDDDQVNGVGSSTQETPHMQTTVPVVARARMVQVAKRVPPSLPPRNPNRASQSKKSEKDADGFDTVSLNGSDHSDITLEKRNSSAETDDGTVKAGALSTDEKSRPGVNGAPGVAGEDEFHSVPPSPAKEHHHGIPGAF